MFPQLLLDHLKHTKITPCVEDYIVIKITGEISVTATELPTGMIIKIPPNMIYIEGYGYVPKEKLGTT